ncbi:MAG: substrate-binding domain-containing protein [Bacillota bacterium]
MKKRKTIGLLINDIDGNYSTLLWLMMKKAAENLDCNLIAYEGRSLAYGGFADRQHHISYEFVDKNRLDGLIMTSSSIANYMKNEEYIEFCKRYSDIPMVSLGIVVPGATSLMIDNKEGMKNQVRHLINDHVYRKIAFVTGPESNTDSVERLEAYLEVLKENNIEVDRSLIFNGDFVSQSGYNIMKEIILNNIQYDAIVFANDDMALAAVKCLKDFSKEHNMDLTPKGVICGFDDSINSSLIKPSLTTVRQPLEELCCGAVEVMIRKIDGEKLRDIVTFPSVLVIRESCGCKSAGSPNLLTDSYLRLVPGHRIHENVQTYSLDQLYDRITEALRLCNIRSCFISKYKDGTVLYDDKFVFDETFDIPEKSELIYAYYNGQRMTIQDDIKNFNTKDLVPDIYIPNDRRFTYLVSPLFFNNEHFGFVCFEVVNDDVINFEPLRGQMSNTLKGALMLLEREKMEKSLLESERLASLGQLIGGISHNLMSPIMSVSGACAGLEDLIKEYKESLGDSEVTLEDHNDIANDIQGWVNRLKEYNSYMAKVITTVKSQAVQLNADITDGFTLEELLNRIQFIKNNNEQIRKSKLSINMNVDSKISITGDITNFIQIIENLIINAIQSYEGIRVEDCNTDLSISMDENSVVFIVKDCGRGMSEDIKNRIFKYMVTTKGKNGTGLSLLLSYSTIKGKFGGEMWFESDENQGTAFYITIPVLGR